MTRDEFVTALADFLADRWGPAEDVEIIDGGTDSREPSIGVMTDDGSRFILDIESIDG